MTEITISTKVSKELEKELREYMKIEHLEKSSAVRRLLFKSLQQWREEYALALLAGKKVTFSKAAKIAGLDVWSFMEEVRKAKIQWVSDKIVKKDLEALK